MSEFNVTQQALDGGSPDGQVTLDGDIVREEESGDA